MTEPARRFPRSSRRRAHSLAGATAALLAVLLPQALALPAAAAEAQQPPLEVRTFFLTDGDAKTLATLLRTIVEARSLAIDESRHTVTLRDLADKMPIAERLVEIADRRPGEAEVTVAVLEVDRAALAAWLAGGERPAAARESTYRLAPGELAAFERSTAATALARPRLSLIDQHRADFRSSGLPISAGADGAVRAAAGRAYPVLDIDVDVKGRIHPAAGGDAELTLDFEIATHQLLRATTVDSVRELAAGRIESTVRLADGETFLVTDLAPAAPDRAPSARNPAGERTLVVALTPRVVWAPEPIPEGLEALAVGTEADARLAEGGERIGSR